MIEKFAIHGEAMLRMDGRGRKRSVHAEHGSAMTDRFRVRGGLLARIRFRDF
jgi:hypothetical protein